jgi:hypothetical protein
VGSSPVAQPRLRPRAELELSLESDHFTDDTGNVHEESINKAARAGVVAGVGDGRVGTGPAG